MYIFTIHFHNYMSAGTVCCYLPTNVFNRMVCSWPWCLSIHGISVCSTHLLILPHHMIVISLLLCIEERQLAISVALVLILRPYLALLWRVGGFVETNCCGLSADGTASLTLGYCVRMTNLNQAVYLPTLQAADWLSKEWLQGEWSHLLIRLGGYWKCIQHSNIFF